MEEEEGEEERSSGDSAPASEICAPLAVPRPRMQHPLVCPTMACFVSALLGSKVHFYEPELWSFSWLTLPAPRCSLVRIANALKAEPAPPCALP